MIAITKSTADRHPHIIENLKAQGYGVEYRAKTNAYYLKRTIANDKGAKNENM